MKTAILPAVKLTASQSRLASKKLAVLVVLAMAAANLLATTVNWISGGPSPAYPSGAGYENGDINGGSAYNTPCGLAIDESGNYLLVADKNNNTVRLLDFSIDDTATLLTYTNYVQANNLFSKPVGVAIDDNYNIFVLNQGQGNNGTVLEFDDTSELIATNLAHITNAAGIAIDQLDDIFVTASNKVIEVTSGGVVSTIATITNANASLQGIVVKHNGLLAVCDSGRDGILLINPGSDVVTTNAGFHGQGDFVTATDTSISNTATFFHPTGITESGDGTLIVTDYGNSRVKAVLANGSVTNVYGVQSNYWAGEQWPGFEDGTVALPDKDEGVSARNPNGVVVAPDGSLYVSEDYYHILRHVTGAGFTPETPPAPIPPTTLTATVVTNAGVVEVNLAWSSSASENVTNYILSRATSSGGPYTIIYQTTGFSYVDTSVDSGITYYYVVQAENAGGESTNSPEASVTIPVPPPPPPTIGWFDYEEPLFLTVFHPFTNGANVFNNNISMAILPNQVGVTTLYVDGPTPLTNSPVTGSSPLSVYQNGLSFYPPLPVTTTSNMTISAVNINAENEQSAIVSDQIIFQCGNPTITGANAAQFVLQDATTNVTYYYTTDGTDPLTNAPTSQQVVSTNGAPVTLSLPISTNFNLEVRAVRPGYYPSGLEIQPFSSSAFVPNTISWGFASGECSSAFVGAAGQTFFAPVTLTMLPGVPIYSLQFNMTVSSSGPGITSPGPATESFNFNAFLEEPIPGVSPVLYEDIPPLMFGGYETGIVPPSQLVTFNGITNFVSLEVSNGNELAVGWLERAGETNLYNTLSQNLITFSQAHDDQFPDALLGEPNGVIVGGYSFQIPTNAANGTQYQIQINRASATDDGIGTPGSSVDIFTPDSTNSSALARGSLNAIKNVTVGSIPYLVGNAYPFGWFNAGDFGNSNLQSADLEQVFESAVYGLNTPPSDSDFYDAMDSCGQLGALDNNPGDEFYGYYTNAGLGSLTLGDKNALFSGDYSLVNNMAFGDGQLDVSDVYLTFLRSEFTNDFVWFQRLWTNGVLVATANYAPAIQSGAEIGSPRVKVPALNPLPTPLASITNTPYVNFASADFVATAGQTLTVPVTATVFGPYPLRMLMLNISVVPLDSSPGITVPVQFTPNPALGSTLGSATPAESMSKGAGNYSALWLPSSSSGLATNLSGVTGAANVGTLKVTIPANATASSSYAIHFDHASASPSGLLSFPKRTLTGLITLSSRTNSYYNDGIPDSWRLRYFGTIYNQLSVSNANADGTGMNNWQKYQAGLNPMDSSSVLNEGLDKPMAQNQQDAVIYWPSVNGQTYIIERSSTLFPPHWTAISTNIGDGTYMEIHDTSGGGSRYYQVTTP